MIRDFAAKLRDDNQAVILDVWPDMTHEFEANGSDLADSMEALMRMKKLIEENERTSGVGLKALDKQKYTELYYIP
jgi:acetyl esterase/lipase